MYLNTLAQFVFFFFFVLLYFSIEHFSPQLRLEAIANISSFLFFFYFFFFSLLFFVIKSVYLDVKRMYYGINNFRCIHTTTHMYICMNFCNFMVFTMHVNWNVVSFVFATLICRPYESKTNTDDGCSGNSSSWQLSRQTEFNMVTSLTYSSAQRTASQLTMKRKYVCVCVYIFNFNCLFICLYTFKC